MKLTGNIKYAAPALSADEAELAHIKAVAGDRPVLAALSTHAGEDEIALGAFKALQATDGLNPLLILAPRHPERAVAILSLLDGQKVFRRSLGRYPAPGDTIWLCDTLGEMGLWLRLANVVFLGGGLPGAGIFGHNPVEPLKLEKHVLSLPDVENFRAEFADMVDAGAAGIVTDEVSLAEAARPFMEGKASFHADTSRLSAYLAGEAPLNLACEAALGLMKSGKRR